MSNTESTQEGWGYTGVISVISAIPIHPPYNPNGWSLTIESISYTRGGLERMTYQELNKLYHEVREMCNQEKVGAMGETIWVENILRTMLVERRLDKFAQLLDLAP